MTSSTLDRLKLSSDRKVSPRSRWYTTSKGKREAKPKIPNAFGLPAGDSCPGLTEFCNSCYAVPIQKMYTNVDKLLWHNFNLLKSCGSNVSKMVDLLDPMIKSINWRGEPKVVRIHWDGDYYSKPYTVAWAQTARNNPEIRFWCYSRSLSYIGALEVVDNLVTYLSVDEFNLQEAKECKKKYPWVKLAFCGDTWEATEELAAQFPGERKGPRCPEISKKIPLVNDEGVSACVSCQLCIKGISNVRFSSSNKGVGTAEKLRWDKLQRAREIREGVKQ